VEQTDTTSNETAAEEVNPELDLVFVCDATGSMGSYIFAAQQNICSIVDRVHAEHEADVRFALVSYRDHPPQDSSYITKVFDFTDGTAQMKSYVDTMSASGGGDGPEAVTAAMDDALRRVSWRPNSTKIAVLIADAPPHGLEPSGDGFPNGDPEGRDPLQIAREMAASGITLYTVGCEPALGAYHFARDFMCNVAEITGGQAIALSSSKLLADVIVNGSAEEIALTKLEREVDAEIETVRCSAAAEGEAVEEEEIVQRACRNLQHRRVTSTQMRHDGAMAYRSNTEAVWKRATSGSESLAACKAKLVRSSLTEGPERDPRLISVASAPALAGISRSSSRRCESFFSRGISLEDVLAEEEEAELEPLYRGFDDVDLPEVSAPQYRSKAAASASYNTSVEEVISMDQVSRMYNRSKAKGRF